MLATKFNYSVNRPIKLWTQLIESKIGAEGFSFFSGCLFSLKVVTNYSTTVDGTERRFKKGAFPERMIMKTQKTDRIAVETSTRQLSADTIATAYSR